MPLKFSNRAAAGRLLAERAASYRAVRPLVLAMPRGGVPVGCELARALGAPLDVLVARRIWAPGQPELAIGAVAPGV
jgi:predicted phosphoribosyltransferase